MQQSAEENRDLTQTHLGKVQALLDSGTFRQLRGVLNSLRPVEIARLLASSPPPSRNVLWKMVDKDSKGEIIEELPEDLRAHFLRDMDAEALVELTEGLDTDDVVDILQQLPEQVMQEVLEAMSDQDRQRVETVLVFDEDTAGGLMNTDTITVRPRFSLDVVLRYLRRHEEIPPSTDSLIVVNRKDDYLGLLPLSKLLTTDPAITVREVMVTDANAIPANMPDREVAKLFEQHDWISAPVVNEQGKLLGRITIDDVVDVIRESADHSLMSMAGLHEDVDTFATAFRTIPRRAIWLGINLLTAVLAAAVIYLFTDVIEKVVILAALYPIIASMGGVGGSQTLTVIIRGMAAGHIGPNNMNWLLSRELRVGAANGVLWAVLLGTGVALWSGDPMMGTILGTALIINLIAGALSGALLPGFLKSIKIDPALAGGVTLTTVTDVVGYLAFLGLATWHYG